MEVNNTSKIYLRAKEIANMLSIGKSTWWLWVKQGKAPKGIKLGNRVTVWDRTTILSFLTQSC